MRSHATQRPIPVGSRRRDPGWSAVNARVRGIYATALTRLFLDAGHAVVDASPPIRDRFDESFPQAPPSVRVEMTTDRQGVGVTGDKAAVKTAVSALTDVGLDTFAWPDPTPAGTVLEGRVTATRDRGAVVSLAVESPRDASAEGFLPYRHVDSHVETGDRVRVQVQSSVPPWTSQRPTLETTLRVDAGLVTLEPGGKAEAEAGTGTATATETETRVAVRDDEAARELAGMVELLGIEPPAGWRATWGPAALAADMAALEAALEDAVDTAETLSASLTTDDDTADLLGVLDDETSPAETPLATPAAGTWIWFGRESRSALDSIRRRVTATMPGHHRIKAGASAASAGVDFAEAVCDPAADGSLPFDAVCASFGPEPGDTIRIEHGKPDGRLITLGEASVTDREGKTLTVTREMTAGGRYDGLQTPREAGDVATTTLKEGRWWYPTTYRSDDGTVKGTYLNVCTPVEVFPEAARYVDLHVDVLRHPDGTVERVDDAVLDDSVAAGDTPPALADRAREVASALENAL